MERKLQEFAQGFQVPRIIAVRHNPPLWGPGGWELETKGLNPDVGNILVTWTPTYTRARAIGEEVVSDSVPGIGGWRPLPLPPVNHQTRPLGSDPK